MTAQFDSLVGVCTHACLTSREMGEPFGGRLGLNE